MPDYRKLTKKELFEAKSPLCQVLQDNHTTCPRVAKHEVSDYIVPLDSTSGTSEFRICDYHLSNMLVKYPNATNLDAEEVTETMSDNEPRPASKPLTQDKRNITDSIKQNVDSTNADVLKKQEIKKPN